MAAAWAGSKLASPAPTRRSRPITREPRRISTSSEPGRVTASTSAPTCPGSTE